MDIIRADNCVELFNGKQPAVNGFEVQRFFFAKKYSKINFIADRNCCGIIIEVACSSGYFHFLHCTIFGI